MNIISVKVEAVLTKFSKSKNHMIIIITIDVKMIENQGVRYFDTLPKNCGNRSSLPIAMGSREEAKIPEFPVEINAKNAAMLMRSTPKTPMETSPPSVIGVSESLRSSTGTIPIVI